MSICSTFAYEGSYKEKLNIFTYSAFKKVHFLVWLTKEHELFWKPVLCFSDPEGDENMIKLISTVSTKPSFLYNINELYSKFVGADTSSVILNFTRVGK